VEFRILGPLEVDDESGPVALGTVKERVVLAVLLLHANEAVSRDRLIDELWGESPPATAKKAVNVYVSQLRKALNRDGADPIETVAGGYRLSVGADRLDATRVQQLLAQARESASIGELEPASELFQKALALWRGRSLAGLELGSVDRHEIERLEELRLTALMDRIDCDLALGRHEQLIGELNRLVGEHPLRERLRAQQMLALYRADRQAEALDAYQYAREALVDDLGIEPSEALQRLQRGILAHDPALEIPTGVGARNRSNARQEQVVTTHEPSPTQVVRKRRLHLHRRNIVLVVLAALALAGGLTAFATRAGGHPALPPPVQPNSLVRLDPKTGKVVTVTPVGLEPGSISATPKALWIVNRGDRTVSRYDLNTHGVQTIGSFASAPYDIAADADGNVWVSNRKPAVTWILRSATGTGTSAVPLETKTIAVPPLSAAAEAVGAGYLWVVAGPATRPTGSDRVSLIDVGSRRLASSIRLGRATTAIAFGYGSAWIGTFDRRQSSAWLTRVRAGSGRESVGIEAGDGWGPLSIATGEGSVWVLTSAGTLVRMDPETARVLRRIRMAAREPAFVAVGAGSVWTANLEDFSVSQIDPQTDKVVRTIPLGSYTRILCGIAATHDAVWVTVGDAYCDTANR
jgi:DNA-binding SARP family transcriptional activator/streptogramin lyase